MTDYKRADVLRILRITSRQMQSWERAGLIPLQEEYSFYDLIQLTKLRDLRAKHVRSEVIFKSVEGMKLASGMANPLIEAQVAPAGRRLIFRHSGRTLEPMSGQFVLEFEASAAPVLVAEPKVKTMPPRETAAEFFARGVALEDSPGTQPQAIAMYQRALELDPRHAAAYINLGTLFYNRHDYAKAEQHYRQAIEADPNYALAYFDLGNVLDETGRLQQAIGAYRMAILLAPNYADAHYNLALAFEKMKQPRKALSHWRAYIKLDTSGPWFTHAKQQIEKIMREEPLRVVSRT